MTERYSSITEISYRRGDATVQKNFYAFKRFFFQSECDAHEVSWMFPEMLPFYSQNSFLLVNLCAFCRIIILRGVLKGPYHALAHQVKVRYYLYLYILL